MLHLLWCCSVSSSIINSLNDRMELFVQHCIRNSLSPSRLMERNSRYINAKVKKQPIIIDDNDYTHINGLDPGLACTYGFYQRNLRTGGWRTEKLKSSQYHYMTKYYQRQKKHLRKTNHTETELRNVHEEAGNISRAHKDFVVFSSIKLNEHQVRRTLYYRNKVIARNWLKMRESRRTIDRLTQNMVGFDRSAQHLRKWKIFHVSWNERVSLANNLTLSSIY